MWYERLLEYLAGKICASDKDRAISFIGHLVKLFKKEFSDKEELEPEFIFGFIITLYNYSKDHQDQNISLSEFAKYCLGIMILFAKVTDDLAIYCSDFVEILSDEKILQELRVEEDLARFRKDYLQGIRQHPEVTPFLQFKQVEDPFKIKKQIEYLAKIEELKLLEKQALIKLNFVVNLRFKNVVDVFTDLLNRVNDQQTIISSLHQYLLPYKGKDEWFDAFILSLNRLLKRSIWSQRFHNKTQLPDNFKINLVFVPPLKLQGLPRHNQEIIKICSLLEDYTIKKSCKTGSLFTKKNHQNYIKEVNDIVRKIYKGDLLTVEAILDELATINIKNQKDELISLRETIKTNYNEKRMRSSNE